ncbi:MAG: amidohydrolase family protein [Oscillospiraceae bacterium]|nr:amidohydrolase family protein [Oscillospiraceae bacterium]
MRSAVPRRPYHQGCRRHQPVFQFHGAARTLQNTFVYCHCFYPEAAQCFDTLTDCENVYFDISSVADDPEKLPQIKLAAEAAIRRIPERILFGSDFGSCSQRAHLDFAAALDITAPARARLMYQNACRLYAFTND